MAIGYFAIPLAGLRSVPYQLERASQMSDTPPIWDTLVEATPYEVTRHSAPFRAPRLRTNSMHRIALLIDRGRDAVTGRGLGRALFDGDHGLVFYYAST